ncbi:ATP-binding cassette domain-containing protein [Nocardioides zeae]|uniref:ATP-binding cassette subfamily B protein IrtB n=1 Tax=Nocardioides zeae TaxID=1457234 RepID=A0AAJ1U3Z3_9ACTN|nr:ABC transporter ATP-binding protein [Nocardioides zeae]MDQ1105420.1 ATP-binding cassette subfamily B protein IrtB [Nocardioides zeae]
MIRALAPLVGRTARRRLLGAALLGLLASLFEAASLLSLVVPLAQVLEGDVPTGAGLTLALGAAWAVCLTAATVVGRASGYGLSFDLHERVASHLLRLPSTWFDASRAGEVSRAAGSQVMDVMAYPGHLMLPALRSTATPAALAAALAVIDPLLGLAALLALPALVAVARWSVRWVAAGDAALSRARADATARLLDHVGLQRVVRLTPHPEAADDLTRAALREVHARSATLVRSVVPGLSAFGAAVQIVLVALVTVLVLRAGSPGGPSAAGVATAVALLAAYAGALRSAAELGAATRSARGALARLQELFGTAVLPEPVTPAPRPGVDPRGTAVTVRALDYRHRDGTPALRGVDLDLAPGTLTVLVGTSGAGKSTLLRLLARADDPTRGAVLHDGVDLRDLGSEEVRRGLGLATQESAVLDDTLLANVRLGRPTASEAEVRAALDAAGLAETVGALDLGLQSPVGENAALVSGGEAQRIGLARALVRRAPLLLLDEPTSSLDPAARRRVVATLEGLRGRATVVVVAHRLDEALLADQVVVVDEGRVVQRGAPEALLSSSGPFRRLVDAGSAGRPTHPTDPPADQEASP